MKNIIILFLLLILPMLAYSQDVIITKKAEKLEVKIIEVSSSEIKYKKLHNLEGPTFVLLSSDVASIIYENGDVQVFEETSLPKNVEKTSIMNNIIRNGNKYIFDGVVMRGDIYSKFLKENCTVAYNQYTKGRTLANVGFLLLGLGLSLDFIAIIPSVIVMKIYNSSFSLFIYFHHGNSKYSILIHISFLEYFKNFSRFFSFIFFNYNSLGICWVKLFS